MALKEPPAQVTGEKGLQAGALGVPLMLLCFAYGTKRFFRGETLTPETEVKVPDNY